MNIINLYHRNKWYDLLRCTFICSMSEYVWIINFYDVFLPYEIGKLVIQWFNAILKCSNDTMTQWPMISSPYQDQPFLMFFCSESILGFLVSQRRCWGYHPASSSFWNVDSSVRYGWFITENPIKMDDLGPPPSMETTIFPVNLEGHKVIGTGTSAWPDRRRQGCSRGASVKSRWPVSNMAKCAVWDVEGTYAELMACGNFPTGFSP